MPEAAISPYYDSVNPDILSRIPVTAKHVLELGCGSGALAARFRRRAPFVRWSGIELAPGPARQARTVLDAVLCADVETLSGEELDGFLRGQPVPDVLVLGDVLEHLREPGAILSRLVARLAPGATVVACIPNVAHWSMVEGLLRGAWTYTDHGLLDRTHLRFFTRDTAIRLLREAGLVVLSVAPRNVPLNPARQARVLDALMPALGALGIDIAQASARMAAMQYVLVAARPPAPAPLLVHHVVMVPHLHEARLLGPAEALAGFPGVHVTRAERTMMLPEVAAGVPRIVVLQRQLVTLRAEWLAAMARIAAAGWLIVAEWDDHPGLLPQPSLDTWKLNPWLPFSGVHAVQVSTDRLADALREHNPEVQVLPNALLDLPIPLDRDASCIRIVCAAVARPGLAGIVGPALDAAAQDPRVTIDIVADPVLFSALQTPRKTLHDLMPYERYLNLLARADIAVMPIQGLAPERYKSPLKFIESAASGAACIGSPVLYGGVIEDGVNGLLAETPEQWTRALLRLVADGTLRRRLAEEGQRSVRDRHLQCRQVDRRLAWYRDLWARRRELRAALAARHPEISASTEV